MSVKSAATSALLRLPPGLRVLVVVGSGAGLMCGALLLLLVIRQQTALPNWFWVIAGIVVVAVAAAVVFIARAIKKRKVNQADEAIREGAAGSSGNVSDPDEIARLDQLRKDFLAAYHRFREHNEDGVYSLPFLMLVGEPGSGKTEAIRHSNINFPSGLNKPSQGAGGTYNMDWWFTNDAIILDTAGRLMFEETDEWNELLRQLNRVRPHCPINGLLLVIPADSLLKDSAEQIEEKADRIAQQINIIKRELGIRFPVFVIISKCDLITGFREFFTHLNDPVLQHQILGWSNPADLDEPFKPEMVDRHLEAVQERLRRRRLSQLFDPPEIDYSGRRADQVDALYAFPEEFMRIKSRLQLYMEKVFTPGPWTKKPPFVRGIYFTSSMQEGQEIDTALAEMLGVEAGELPGGRSWQKDKAYFLKDLFLQKVFPEQGLVSRASNAVKNYHRNKLLVQITGTCAIVLSAVLFIWTWMDFRQTIGARAAWWHEIDHAVREGNLPRALAGSSDGLAYKATEFHVDGDPYTPARFLRKSADEAAQPIEPRNLMRIVAFFADPFRGYPTAEAQQAHMQLLEYMLLEPLVEHARSRLRNERDWAPGAGDAEGVAPATQALAELIRLETIAQGGESIGELQLEALLGYVLDADAQPEAKEVQHLQHALATMDPWGPAPQLAARLGAGEDGPNRDVIETALAAHEAFWQEQLGSFEGGPFEQINQVEAFADRFDHDEQRLIELSGSAMTTDQWRTAFRRVDDAGDALENATAAGNMTTLAGAFEEAVGYVTATCESAYDRLRAAKGMRDSREVESDDESETSAGSSASAIGGDIAERLRYGCEPREIDPRRLERWQEIDARLLAVVDGDGRHAFQQRRASYRSVNTLFMMGDHDESFEMGTFRDALSRIDAVDRDIVFPAVGDGMDEPLRQRQASALELVTTAASGARESRREGLYARALRTYATKDIARHVEEHASPREMPRVPLSRAAVLADDDDRYRHFNRRFDPEAASVIFSDWKAIVDGIGDEDQGTAVWPDWPNAERAVKQYMREYRTYWETDACDLVRVSAADYDSWSDFYGAITSIHAGRSDVERALEAFARVRETALDTLPDGDVLPAFDEAALKEYGENYDDYQRKVMNELGDRGFQVVEHFAGLERPIQFRPYLLITDPADRGDCVVEGYFRSLQSAKFRIIAEEAREPTQAAMAQLRRSDRQRFPVVWEPRGEPALDFDGLRAVGSAAAHLAGSGDARDGNVLRIGIPEVDDQLAVIRGEDGAVRSADRDVIRAIRMISEVFGSDKLTIEILGWNGRDLDRGGATPAVNVFQEFSIHQADRALLHQRTGDAASGGIERTVHPHQPLQFKFNNIGEEPKPISEARNWTLARMLQDGGKPDERSGDRDTGFRTWHLPLRGQGDGRELIFWITVKFASPLPHPSDWPRPDNWPQF